MSQVVLYFFVAREFRVTINKEYSSPKDLDFSVSHGSVAGTTLYWAYASIMRKWIPDRIDLYGYTDDHALKNSFLWRTRESDLNTLNILEDSLRHVKTWMDDNRLNMNDSKMEFIQLGSRQQLGSMLHITSLSMTVQYKKSDCHNIFRNLLRSESHTEDAHKE